MSGRRPTINSDPNRPPRPFSQAPAYQLGWRFAAIPASGHLAQAPLPFTAPYSLPTTRRVTARTLADASGPAPCAHHLRSPLGGLTPAAGAASRSTLPWVGFARASARPLRAPFDGSGNLAVTTRCALAARRQTLPIGRVSRRSAHAAVPLRDGSHRSPSAGARLSLPRRIRTARAVLADACELSGFAGRSRSRMRSM